MPRWRFALVALWVYGAGAAAEAQTAPVAPVAPPRSTTVHPMFASAPGAAESPQDRDARRRFSDSVARFGLGPVETIDIPGPPTPRAPELLRTGMAAVEKLQWAEAQAALDGAAAEAAATGAAGLTTAELADLYLFQATAAQKADWQDLPGPLTDITPAAAKAAYLRAAVLAPARVLPPRRFRPMVVACWERATAEIKARPRGTILVRAAGTVQISIDGGPPLLSPAVAQDLPYGDHIVRGEDLGRRAWVAVVALAEPALEIDVPEMPALTLDDAEAAAHARRLGASFALVASVQRGARLELTLALVDARTGARRDSTVVPFAGDAGLLESTVMRLDEQARKDEVLNVRGETPATPGHPPLLGLAQAPLGPPPPPGAPRLGDDPAGWARAHWPLVTAVGVAVGCALILGLAVASDDKMTVR